MFTRAPHFTQSFVILGVFVLLAPSAGTVAAGTDVWAPESSGTTEILSGVWGRGSEFVVVGSGGTILRFDGAAWQPMNSNSTSDLQGVWGNSFSDVFAVGPDGTVLHYTGSHWTPMTTPTTEFLRGVWGTAPTNVFVTGTRGTIIRYDGGHWQSMDSGSPNRLYDIWGAAADDVFVTGHLATILHYDGLEWSPMDGGVRPTLWGVWGAATNDVYVVGGGGVIIHFDGSAWSMMDSGTTEDLFRVWGHSASEIFAVGGNGTILRFDGAIWTPMASGTLRTLKDIFGSSPDNIVAVGDHGVILRYSGGAVPIFIREFDARCDDTVVDLSWWVVSAEDLRGFRLLKRDSHDRESVLPAGGQLLQNDVRSLRDPAVQPGQSYRYMLLAELSDGSPTRSPWVRVDVPGHRLRLEQNRPNPFNPSTQIAFSLAETATVRLTIFDSGGRAIVTLADAIFPSGSHTVEWNTRDSAGRHVASGVYFCRIETGHQRAVIKMTLTK